MDKVASRKGEADFGEASGEDFSDGGSRADGLAKADATFTDAAVIGGEDLGAFEVVLCAEEFCFRGFDVCCGFFELGLAKNEFGGGLGVSEVFPVEEGLFSAGIFLGKGGFRAGQAGFGGG